MTNPMLANLTTQNSLKPLIDAVRKSDNPMAILSSLAMTNPKLKEVMNYAQSVGDPKQAFYKMAEAKGVDPETILSRLR